MAHQGNFFVLEGIDGSGKGAQFTKLVERLEAAGHDVVTFDFPRYDEESSYFVKQYLSGNYGSADEVGPYTASLFYALDRYEAASAIRQAVDAGKVVLANRFTGSSMAHQGTKFRNPEERRGFFIWLDNLEFQMLSIPRPDMNIVLRLPAETAQALISQRPSDASPVTQRDVHEDDLSHLGRTVEVYDDLCNLFPKDFIRVDCVRNEQLLDVEAIHSLLWEKINPLLPKPAKKQSASKTAQTAATPSVATTNPYTKRVPSGTIITNAGYEYLNEAVTSSTGPVYAFTNKLDPASIAAALASFCRGSDSIRLVLLDQYAFAANKDLQLAEKAVVGYGDDSVKQLVGVHVAVEDASTLLTKKLEWGRLATYIEQSPRNVRFEERDEHGSYRYFVPSHFDGTTKNMYCDLMDQLFDTYAEVVKELTAFLESTDPTAHQMAAYYQATDMARMLLPVASRATVGIFASAQAIESLIVRLAADELPESNATAERILEATRKLIPAFMQDADRAEKGGAITAYRAYTASAIRKFAEQHLPTDYTADNFETVTLTDIWPRNELDLVADMLYGQSDQSLQDIRNQVNGWTYNQKFEAFKTYIGERLGRRHLPGRALEKAHYSWDIVCEYAVFRNLQRHRMVDDLEWQQLSPRFGYEVPKVIEDAGLTDTFERGFDLSLRLFSALQQAGYPLEAQYATLQGHKMRWKVTVNAREAMHITELYMNPQGNPAYQHIVRQMYEKLANRHPLLAEAMRFATQPETDEMILQAAERYNQFKLSL